MLVHQSVLADRGSALPWSGLVHHSRCRCCPWVLLRSLLLRRPAAIIPISSRSLSLITNLDQQCLQIPPITFFVLKPRDIFQTSRSRVYLSLLQLSLVSASLPPTHTLDPHRVSGFCWRSHIKSTSPCKLSASAWWPACCHWQLPPLLRPERLLLRLLLDLLDPKRHAARPTRSSCLRVPSRASLIATAAPSSWAFPLLLLLAARTGTY